MDVELKCPSRNVLRHDAQESLEALPPGLDDLIREPVREDISRERGDVDDAGRAKRR